MSGDLLPGDDLGAQLVGDVERLGQQAAVRLVEGLAPPPPPEVADPQGVSGPGLARRAVGDVARGITEAPVQIVGGVRDAAHGALSGIAAFDQWASDALGLPKLQILNDEGAFDPRLLSAEEAGEAEVLLPDVREPTTVTGGMVRGVSQFLTGFVGGSKALGGLGRATAKARAGRAAAASGISDFAAFDGHEERLSDLIQSVPALENPVTEFLASDMDDSELVGRLKNVGEGAMSDALVTGLASALRGVRAARAARADVGGETFAQAAERLARDPEVIRNAPLPGLDALKVPDAPLTFTPQDVAKGSDELRAYLDGLEANAKTVSSVASEQVDSLADELVRYEQVIQRKRALDASSSVSERRAIDADQTSVHQGVKRFEAALPSDEVMRGLSDAQASELAGQVFSGKLLAAIEDGASAEQVMSGPDFQKFVDFHINGGVDDFWRSGGSGQPSGGPSPRTASGPDRSGVPSASKGGGTAAQGVGAVETDGGSVYVNWNRIETTDDVKSVIQQLADADKPGVDAARRGVRTNADTVAAAGDENAWQLLVERRNGAPLNAEQSLAVRRLWAASGARLSDAARAMRDAPTEANTFLFRRAMALHGVVQREVLAVRTETARALQQWSIPAGPDETVARQVSETLNLFDDAEGTEELARRIVALAEDGDQGAIDALSRKSAVGAVGDMVFEYWVNAVLSGPKTHMVNAMSNMAVTLMAPLERLLASRLGRAMGDLDAVDVSEAGAMLHGAFAALPDAWRFAVRTMRSGESGFGLQKLEAPRVRSWSSEALGNTRNETFNRAMNIPLVAQGINALGSVITVPGRALGAGDEFFKTINYRMEVHGQAARVVGQELRAGKIGPADVKRRLAEIAEDPPDSIIARAREFAQYNTFTNDAGRYAAAINSFRHKAPPLRFVMPFVNTPANILRYLTERSPAAPLLGDVRADIRAGGQRQSMALARMGLGSVAMLTAFDFAMNGQITGAGPSNPRQRDALRRAGWQPYSVRIGDRWFAYNRIDPMGGQLGIAANMAEAALNSDDDPGEGYDEAVYGAIGAVGQQMMDRTYLQGLSDLFVAMSEPSRFAPRYFERLAGSFVPAFVREIKSIEDPVLRRAHDTLSEIRSRIPGLSEGLPARHDLWGRQIDFQSGLGAGYDAVSPIYSSQINAEPIDQAFQEIGYFPGMPANRLTVDSEVFLLRNQPEVYERYVVLQGGTRASALPEQRTASGSLSATGRRLASYGERTLKDTLNAIVTGSADFDLSYDGATWEAGDAYQRGQIVKLVIADYRRAARDQLLSEFPEVFRPGAGRR